ncbi:hypothetical protein C4D60_Mb07t21320 [Musa balbisiana]|uniref:Uncharacterized protein n=1 Tax=Musa balbisiana TaxID=52838 RepID=A0A4S8JH59_MUSBA|nr:hypothetical protein C4D60_Mb07t21320 [Musa balbisiana]
MKLLLGNTFVTQKCCRGREGPESFAFADGCSSLRVALFSVPPLPTFPNLASGFGFGRRAVVLSPYSPVFLPCDWPSGIATASCRAPGTAFGFLATRWIEGRETVDRMRQVALLLR